MNIHFNTLYRMLAAMLLLTSCMAAHADTYTSARLQRIDSKLKQTGKNYRIHRRTNRYGEVEHIGLALFPSKMPDRLQPSCDFLERYMLETNLTAGTDYALILAQQPVYYNTGNAQTALAIDSLYDFSIDEIEYHRCRASWSKNGKRELEVVYDLDWRMMSGCSTRELEQNLMRNIMRHKPEKYSPLPENGTYIISRAFSSNVFLKQNGKDGKRQYIFSVEQMSRSAANLMLADDMPTETMAELTLSRYDNPDQAMTLKWSDALNYFLAEEHCTPFFAIKKKHGDDIEGVLLLANKSCGYMHMISVSIGRSLVKNGGKGSFRGRLTAYIPMHNVKQEYLNLTEYETIR